METTLVAPHCAGTSRICGKIKKSNVLHYICHFTSDKNNFLHSWLFFSLTWAENEHWQPLVALRPLEAVKSFISCPCDTGKQPLIPKIVSDTGKMTNEWSKVLLSKIILELHIVSSTHFNITKHKKDILQWINGHKLHIWLHQWRALSVFQPNCTDLITQSETFFQPPSTVDKNL